MNVCAIYRFSSTSEQMGYLAVLSNVGADGRHYAMRYVGGDFGNNFPMITLDRLKEFNIKTLRSLADFSKYIKMFNPSLSVHPVEFGGVVFDSSFVHTQLGTFRWSPFFERVPSKSNLSLISNDTIVCYTYCKPIFISVMTAKRHIPKENKEILYINKITGLVTRQLSGVVRGKYVEGSYHLEGTTWVRDSYNQIDVAGYKMR